MKVISFSLWGNNPKYCVGAIRNAELALKIYPGWQTRFYCGSSTPASVMDELENIGHSVFSVGTLEKDGRLSFDYGRDRSGFDTHVILYPEIGDWRGMFWRFHAAIDPSVEVMISRDCDSRLSLREKSAVDEWLASDKGFHTMHDHPYHTVPILGGMFGIKKGCVPEFGQLMSSWKMEDRWQTDQDFLNSIIWPRVQHNCSNHDSFFIHLWGGKTFPIPRTDGLFVGAVFDENDVPVQEHLNILARHEW